MEEKDLCLKCRHLWYDFPLPLDAYIPHCDIADEKEGFRPLYEIVPYPCIKCPYDSYADKNDKQSKNK